MACIAMFRQFSVTSVTMYHRMCNSESGTIAATMEIVGLYFDLEAREKVSLPAAGKDRLDGFLVAPDAG